MPYKAKYEILYKYRETGDKFVSHISGRPDIREGHGETLEKASSKKWFESGERNKVVVLESEEISEGEYQDYLDHQEHIYKYVSRNHRNGVE
jgi:hypothetical protein